MAAVKVPAQFQDAIESDEEVDVATSGNDSTHVTGNNVTVTASGTDSAHVAPADGEGQWDELEWDEEEDTDIFFDTPSASSASAAPAVKPAKVMSSRPTAPAKEVLLHVTGAGGQNDKRFEDTEAEKWLAGDEQNGYYDGEEDYNDYDEDDEEGRDYAEPVEQWADATGGEKTSKNQLWVVGLRNQQKGCDESNHQEER